MTHYVSNLTSENLLATKQFLTRVNPVTTSASTLVLTKDSQHVIEATGSTVGYTVRLQDATTVEAGYRQSVHNNSTVAIDITDASGMLLLTLQPRERAMAVLIVAGTVSGRWSIEFLSISTNMSFGAAQESHEDFLFDAYAGNGSNDNQYSFTATDNNGNSDVDGATTPTSNDYEGMHILNTLNSATARPLVSAFNNVNRIALGAQPQSYELRVRIPTLSDSLQTFNARFGLMDGILIGQPVNGVLFSYNHSVSGGNWTAYTVKASTATTINTGVPVVANTWYKIGVMVNSTATRVDFFIDGNWVGASSTNIPSGITQALRFVCKCEKSVGTTSRQAHIDYVAWKRSR